MLDDTAVNKRIRKQFPFRILVLGRGVIFRESAAHSGRIAIDIEDGFIDVVDAAFRAWQHRRRTGIWMGGPEERAIFDAMKARLESKESMKRFLKFFVRQPIGPRLLIFDKKKKFKYYAGRQTAINEAYFTWDAVNNWPRNSSGKLTFNIACAGYRKRCSKFECEPGWILPHSLARCMCCSVVSDLTGCCSTHKQTGERTLFTYYPFFKTEGFPELTE